MRRLIWLLAAGLFVLVCQSAQADTFTAASGAWSKKTNWSVGHPPTVEEEAVIPAGHEAKVEKSTSTGPLMDNGHITGPQNLTVFGAVHLAPGSFDLTGQLDLKGWGTVTAEDTIYYLRIDGNDTLAAPLHAGVLTAYRGSTFTTDGYPVTVDTETYPFEEADWQLGSSTFSTGYWLVFPASLEGEVHAEEATINITGTGGGFEGVFKGEHWTYGNVIFSGEGQSEGSYTVNGTLAFHGNSTMEAGRTVTVGSLGTTGTTEHPVHVSSPGSTIVCGCMVPSGLVLEGITVL